ncbi:MAG: PP2C family protein-serine/threonine phosphatase [Terriglobia bacterium]
MAKYWMKWSTDLKAFWETVPGRSAAVFLTAIFCLFCALAFIGDTLNSHALTSTNIVLNVVIGGGFPAVWIYFIMRRMIKSIIAMAAILAAEIWWRLGVDHKTLELPFNSAAFRHKLTIDAAVAMAMILAGYLLFVAFFQLEGKRFFTAYTEVRLASDIHRALVPKVNMRTAGFEFFGLSVPSGELGGDLVDFVDANEKWIGYVADVSGHGVSAGVLMAMTKSAVRMRLSCEGSDGELLEDLNRVLKPMTESNMFITFAYASWAGGPDLKFGLAGHLPLLHFRKSRGDVEELFVSNLPISISANQRFDIGNVRFECGDILAIVTDGLTEVFDSKGREFGMEPLKRILAGKAEESLSGVSAEMRRTALRYGKQADDQTLLLLRRTV